MQSGKFIANDIYPILESQKKKSKPKSRKLDFIKIFNLHSPKHTTNKIIKQATD